ncbi:MAG: DUF5668 domain-containing protein [Treponema sp.]|jgi:hypothetical protein|nr:DUF5668 domain-containing protein [Treponema sp.]
MHRIRIQKITARLIFIFGLLFMLLGCAFLLGSLAETSEVSVLGSFVFVIIGSGCAFLAVKFNKRSHYLFLATFFLQVGFFLFLSALKILPLVFTNWWPILSVFAGLALIPAGWRHYGKIRPWYVVPSLAFIILGCVLLIFSLDVVSFSFKQFMLDRWPLLLVLAGLILVLISLGTKGKSEDTRP